MSIRVISDFSDKSQAAVARRELRKLGITADYVSTEPGQRFNFDLAQRDFNFWALRLGLAGSAAGCLLGILIVPSIPMKHLMFSAIMPLSTTYMGLAVGCFIAGAIAQIRRNARLSTTLPEACLDAPKSKEVVDVQFTDQSLVPTVHTVLEQNGATTIQVIVTPDHATHAPVVEEPLSLLLSA